jgi:hypothetical protein
MSKIWAGTLWFTGLMVAVDGLIVVVHMVVTQ